MSNSTDPCVVKALALAVERGLFTVLDIGAGKFQRHARALRAAGLQVCTCDFFLDSDFVGDFNALGFAQKFDIVWISHVLEHQPNPNAFLEKALGLIKPGGIACITVPPYKPQIVGGHLTLWNTGLLLYNLIRAGNDCRDAIALNYGYNISVIVSKAPIILPKLRHDKGDIRRLRHFFPFPAKHGFNGNIQNINWPNDQ